MQAQSQESNQGLFVGYQGGEEMPLAGYATLLGVYNAALAAALLAANQSGRALPERTSYQDVLLLGIATHKLGRIITKDWVTSPLRAPFTEYKGSAGGGEVNEKSRGQGLQRAVGDLLTCPWCIAPWVAGALAFGFIFKPRTTRLICQVFTAVTISDFLQHAYNGVKEKKVSPSDQ